MMRTYRCVDAFRAGELLGFCLGIDVSLVCQRTLCLHLLQQVLAKP
jgi:hypothetical protein